MVFYVFSTSYKQDTATRTDSLFFELFFCVLYSSHSISVLGISNKAPSIAHIWYPLNVFTSSK